MVLERAGLDDGEPLEAEQEQDRLLQPFVHDDFAVDDLRHAGLTAIEELDRLVDDGARFGRGHHGREIVASVPEPLDLFGEIAHTRSFAARRSNARVRRSSVCVSESRTCAEPSGP